MSAVIERKTNAKIFFLTVLEVDTSFAEKQKAKNNTQARLVAWLFAKYR